ncbi:MAG: 2,3,4,5-tetrahydropyridine-2,6-dicarboxylate N-acetyltransferase [Anaerovoracaceae bacterium]|jgi:tetrahydrodipicolinate N-acetyltransferase
MDTRDIIRIIRNAKKTTPVKVYLKERQPIVFENCRSFGCGDRIIFGDWSDIEPILMQHEEHIIDYVVECDRRNSILPLADIRQLNARVEPGAIIRSPVTIGDHAVIMMGAVINIGASIGRNTMIDMNAVLGARATVGENCHIGAGAVLAGVLEPLSQDPVVIEDDVLVGANAVILEGTRVGKGAVVAAGAIVISDVPAGTMVAGVPAKVIKSVEEISATKREILHVLRELE